MGRKKKNIEVAEEDDISDERISFLHGDVKRSIAAVVLFALAMLFTLGFFESAGMLGNFLNSILGKLFGWGKWIFPPVLMTMSVFLLQRRQSPLSEFLKLTGLSVAFMSLLGFFHMYLDGDLLKVAQNGIGGGYIGFALVYVLQKFTGMAAGTIILMTLFLTGLMTAFNVSLIHFFERLRLRLKQEKDDEAYDGNNESISDADKSAPLSIFEGGMQTHMKQEELSGVIDGEVYPQDDTLVLESENIRHIEFVGDTEDTRFSKNDDVEDPTVFLEKTRTYKKRAPKRHWILPGTDLLDTETQRDKGVKNEQNAFIIQRTLKHFGIEVELGEIQTGPTVTQYTFRPTAGTKLSRITALSNDLALELAAQSIRIEAPIPGKSLVGIEVPNRSSSVVRLKTVLTKPGFVKRDGNMMLVLGEDVMGEYVLGDLRKMPHLLVAGATNSGKSVCINTLLLSLLYQNSPDDLKLILVDPKRVELSLYNKIPHLLTDVIVENKKVVNVLKWAVSEMERRYKVLQEVGSRDLASYKQKFDNGEKRVVVNVKTNKSSDEALEKLPYIVIVIDEMADLIMAHRKDVEGLIARLSQMSRAVGIHLILATQRPSVEVLTGLIKANITTRIAFQVATQIDSRTILDHGGAEKLLGRGDMLYVSTGSGQPRRLQGVFISEDEVKRVVDFLKKQKREDGNEEDLLEDIAPSSDNGHMSQSGDMSFDIDYDASSGNRSSEDDLYTDAKEVAIQAGKASASLLQRRLRIGYSRAARILDLLEADGIVGPADGAKPREVYADASGNSAQGGTVDDGETRRHDDSLYEQEKRDKWQM
jgi:S-DNA-T family DNA segregation ATPase FtsK/SpoIIIE